MANGHTRRQALYFPADMLAELQSEAQRQDRSISWLIQQAWKIARLEMRRVPSTSDFLPSDYEAMSGSPSGADFRISLASGTAAMMRAQAASAGSRILAALLKQPKVTWPRASTA